MSARLVIRISIVLARRIWADCGGKNFAEEVRLVQGVGVESTTGKIPSGF